MYKKRFLFGIVLYVLLQNLLFAQDVNLKREFVFPLKFETTLAGNFGEPRHRHFHSGIDFRTFQDGKEIVSVADGFIARIVVSPWGYGLGLYVEHFNSYTSVYGHLIKFRPDIQNFVRKIQYEKKSFAIDTILDPELFLVKKSELIAYSGNTGSSEGPHLHFEIRETKTQNAINTVNSVYYFKDDIAPEISALVLYPLTYNSFIDGKKQKVYLKLRKQDGIYVCSSPLPLVKGLIGIGLQYVDRMNGTQNRYGAKTVSLFMNNEILYKSNLDKISFELQANKNSMFDFEFLLKEKIHVHKLFVEKGNQFMCFDSLVNNGMFSLAESTKADFKIFVSDYNNNTSQVQFSLTEDKNDYTLPENSGFYIKYDSVFLFVDSDFRFETQKNTLFYDSFIDMKKGESSKYSNSYYIGDDYIAVNKDFKLSFFLNDNFVKYIDKVFVVREHNKNLTYLKPIIEQNFISAYSSYFGKFYLWIDTIPPKITPQKINKTLNENNLNYVSFKVEDELSGIKSYNIFINDKWVLAQYEPKTKTIYYEKDEFFEKASSYKLKVVVSDNCGNIASLEY